MGKHKMYHPSSRARWILFVLSLVALCVFGTWWVTTDSQQSSAVPNPVIGSLAPTETHLPDAVMSPTPLATEPTATASPAKPFVPHQVKVGGVGKRPVQALGRILVGENQFSLPDPEDVNPHVFAWDADGAKPGSKTGAVNFTAHTFPPGQDALGNQLFEQLQVGETLTVQGVSYTLDYKVVQRLEVRLADYPQSRVLDTNGRPTLTITVCSGERRGPGDWTMRTVWIAEPME